MAPIVKRVTSMSDAEIQKAARMLWQAFEHDVLTSYFLLHLDQYSIDFWATRVRFTLQTGEIWQIGDMEAISMWFAPGRQPDMSPDGQRRAGWDQLLEGAKDLRDGEPYRYWKQFETALGGFDEMNAALPPAHYLNVIAVSPEHQRKGYGSALMRHHVAMSDAAGEDSYLETGSEDDIRFYRKLGFEITATTVLGDDSGTSAHQMRRSAPRRDADVRRLVAVDDAQLRRLAGMMHRAFLQDDMVGGFVLQHNEELATAWFVTRMLQAILQGGEVWTLNDVDAVAIWWPPGKAYDMSERGQEQSRWPTVLELSKRLLNDEPMGAYKQMIGLFDKWAPPAEAASWRLNLLAVDSTKHRQGLGTRLLRHHLAMTDALGEHTHLETESQADVDFYTKTGFRITAEQELANPRGRALRVKQMSRAAVPAAS